MFDLTGRVALVTGASGGIGGAIARVLHQAGATVLCSGTRLEALEQLTAELGERAVAMPGDLSDPAVPDQLVKRAEAEHERLDILVNNAAFTRDHLGLRMKDDDWQQVLDVNLTAAFRLTRSALRGMMKRRDGRVIAITSVVGVAGNPGQANYAASKAGLIGMSKSLAAEVASRHVTVNCVAPGFISTPMTDAVGDDQRQKIISAIPSGAFGKPEDVAAAVLYLASAEARYVTGQTLHVNGGLLMV